MHEQTNVVFAGLFHHEIAQRLFCGGQGFVKGHAFLHVGHQGVGVNVVQDGRHNKQGEEQSQTHQHGVGGRLACAQCLAQNGQHNDDAHKGGHHEQKRWQQGKRCHQGQQLERQAVLLLAFGAACDVDHGDALSGGGQWESQHGQGNDAGGQEPGLLDQFTQHEVLHCWKGLRE